LDERSPVDQFRVRTRPNYIPQADEQTVFRAAFASRIPLVIKGPTGCGKTRFIEHMAYPGQAGTNKVRHTAHGSVAPSSLRSARHSVRP
jgi:MoxR-like ATPase